MQENGQSSSHKAGRPSPSVPHCVSMEEKATEQKSSGESSLERDEVEIRKSNKGHGWSRRKHAKLLGQTHCK